MSKDIKVTGALVFPEGVPTRAGEAVNSVGEIYDIPAPRVGMIVYDKSTGINYIVRSLKAKAIDGVLVDNAQVDGFEELLEKQVTWINEGNSASNMNDFVDAGVYDIKGERTRGDDNLPLRNIGGGHTFHARLEVLDSSIAPAGKSDDICITQKLTLSNRVAGDGDVYIRTGRGASKDAITWETWGKLQQNVEVGEVDNLDNLIDNGIYSGVWTKGQYNAYPVTFVCVVINDYFIGTAPRRISQFLYRLSKFDGSTVYQTRVWNDKNNKWSDWEIINKAEIDSMITKASSELTNYINSTVADAKRDILEGIDPDEIDSIKDIVTWIKTHGGDVTAIYEAIQENTTAINNETTRAKNAEGELNTAISDEIVRAVEREDVIARKALKADTAYALPNTEVVNVWGKSVDGSNNMSITISAATTEMAGVMTAEDKKTLNANTEEIASLERVVFNRFGVVDSGINHVKQTAARTDGNAFTSSATEVRLTTTGVDTSQQHTSVLPAATAEKAGVMTAEDKKKIDGLENGNTIVGQAREIHSRNGKNVTDSFLSRTTAGSGTIGDGVATLKSVGGNIVKNLVDGTLNSGWGKHGTANTSINNGVIIATDNTEYSGVKTNDVKYVDGHKYYLSAFVYNKESTVAIVTGSKTLGTDKTHCWTLLSGILADNISVKDLRVTSYTANTVLYATKPLVIDLTEMFGAGNELDKDTCDKLFGTMDALPQGLTIANPTEFRSTGFNQADPNKVLVGKGIDNGAIADKVGSNLAVVPCLPCKIGVGENNGYCIHGAFDGGAENVYLTPLNPLEVDGELYMHELTKDETKGIYVPQIKGYMLVEVPNATDLCVHFLWSEDKCERDTYEPYYESKVELPAIPQMSEYGLAGIKSSGTLACDEIDFVKGVYRKKIGAIDLGSLYWGTLENTGILYSYSIIPNIKPAEYGKATNAVMLDYTIVKNISISDTIFNNLEYMIYTDGKIYLRDNRYINGEDFKAAVKGKILFYELAEPIEYPLPKVANNYTSSDYGVEQFDGAVPCNANNLYYMRSLAGETRNFLDRLMAGLGTDDATAVADRILAVVNPVVEPVIEEEI